MNQRRQRMSQGGSATFLPCPKLIWFSVFEQLAPPSKDERQKEGTKNKRKKRKQRTSEWGSTKKVGRPVWGGLASTVVLRLRQNFFSESVFMYPLRRQEHKQCSLKIYVARRVKKGYLAVYTLVFLQGLFLSPQIHGKENGMKCFSLCIPSLWVFGNIMKQRGDVGITRPKAINVSGAHELLFYSLFLCTARIQPQSALSEQNLVDTGPYKAVLTPEPHAS